MLFISGKYIRFRKPGQYVPFFVGCIIILTVFFNCFVLQRFSYKLCIFRNSS